MITLGTVLLITGILLGSSALTTTGAVLLIIGAALWFLGRTGNPIGPRSHYC